MCSLKNVIFVGNIKQAKAYERARGRILHTDTPVTE